jgi:hypothetical protein
VRQQPNPSVATVTPREWRAPSIVGLEGITPFADVGDEVKEEDQHTPHHGEDRDVSRKFVYQ